MSDFFFGWLSRACTPRKKLLLIRVDKLLVIGKLRPGTSCKYFITITISAVINVSIFC